MEKRKKKFLLNPARTALKGTELIRGPTVAAKGALERGRSSGLKGLLPCEDAACSRFVPGLLRGSIFRLGSRIATTLCSDLVIFVFVDPKLTLVVV